jgi:hypothetical protein
MRGHSPPWQEPANQGVREAEPQTAAQREAGGATRRLQARSWRALLQQDVLGGEAGDGSQRRCARDWADHVQTKSRPQIEGYCASSEHLAKQRTALWRKPLAAQSRQLPHQPESRANGPGVNATHGAPA